MTTIDLIKILSDNEYGAITHKPRNISLTINGKYMPGPRIALSSTGDGIAGPEIDLDIIGEFMALEQEPCEDCISRKAILDCQCTIDESETLGIPTKNVVNVDDILNAKLVQPKPKTGQWFLLDECSNSGYYCSECHKKLVKEGWSDTVKKIKYCPNCGCRMVEPRESEDKE